MKRYKKSNSPHFSVVVVGIGGNEDEVTMMETQKKRKEKLGRNKVSKRRHP